ncbi:hypothetical protein O1611_g10421 [Lasiodiplodia mahajangana]|uniref:Uncharacterized protein n=1 Tax=Lasiodiplodia mahajangana TaxID=1108764 RepID=A0ACC2IYS7_9PEZI|nr:hypothetical protein O1611_g10421 [Lasiodiplodia mahajangana]
MAEDSDTEDVPIGPVVDAAHVRVAATFVSDEAPKLHPTFGGSPSLNPESGQFRSPVQTLAVALRDYVPAAFKTDVGPNTPKPEWDGLFDKINEVEERAHGTEHGPRAIFCRLALKIGENKEVIDPWVSLIPNDYGLAVVKCAIAITLNVAERYAEEKQKVFDALIEIRETIGEANSKTKSFQQEPEISKCAGLLHEAIVTAIQEILQSFPQKKPPGERRRLIPRWGRKKDAEFNDRVKEQKQAKEQGDEIREEGNKEKKEAKKKRTKIDVDAVMEKARTAAKDLDRAVDEWKTRTMLKTEEYSKDTNEQVAIVLEWVITEADPILKDSHLKTTQIQAKLLEVEHRQKAHAKKQDKKTNRILQELTTGFTMLQAREAANQGLLEMALDEVKKKYSGLKKKMRALEKQQQREGGDDASRRATPGAIITLAQLLRVLFDSSFGEKCDGGQITDVESMLEHMNDGLDTVIRRRARVDVRNQGQAQSLFQESRFLAWLESDNPDMILIDGNMESSSRDKVSAMSLFCANFVLTMTKLDSQDVYTHFFCGFHNSPMDPWQGPRGLLQFVIIQLLAALEARNCLSLDFLFKQSQIRELKESDIHQLCRVLHELVSEFPPETTVYCIIDGIQFFYRDAYLSDLELLVRHLEEVIADDYLKPKFKVMMTVPFRSI